MRKINSFVVDGDKIGFHDSWRVENGLFPLENDNVTTTYEKENTTQQFAFHSEIFFGSSTVDLIQISIL